MTNHVVDAAAQIVKLQAEIRHLEEAAEAATRDRLRLWEAGQDHRQFQPSRISGLTKNRQDRVWELIYAEQIEKRQPQIDRLERKITRLLHEHPECVEGA